MMCKIPSVYTFSMRCKIKLKTHSPYVNIILKSDKKKTIFHNPRLHDFNMIDEIKKYIFNLKKSYSYYYNKKN